MACLGEALTKTAVSALLTALTDNAARKVRFYKEVRWDIARALGCIGRPAVPALMAALKNPDVEVRYFVVNALEFAGTAAKSAMPALSEIARKDENKEVREAAAEALRKIAM